MKWGATHKISIFICICNFVEQRGVANVEDDPSVINWSWGVQYIPVTYSEYCQNFLETGGYLPVGAKTNWVFISAFGFVVHA